MTPSILPLPKKWEFFPGTVPANLIPAEALDPKLPPEGCRLTVTPDGILLEAGSERGLIWARSTLAQLRFQYPEGLPCMTVEDAPAFALRSIHIDSVRHFFSLEELKKMLAAASLFKINHLHWHISDDQGWRIESEVFPELCRISSRRKGDHFGCRYSDAEEGGYYTKAQVRELVEYCAGLGIEITPEVDIPGHVMAILAAYPHLSCTGEKMEVYTKAGITSELLCAGKEEVFDFLERLFGELLELFPGRRFHIGGDEAPKTRWQVCPHCRKRMEEEGLENLRQLQGYMMNRVASFLESRGRQAIVWNDGAYGGNLDSGIALQVWFGDQGDILGRHAEKGGQFILSPTTNCYCDYPYGLTPLRKVYELDLTMENLPRAQILGTESLIWTEFIRTNEQLERYAWPRFAASAEVGWCGEGRPGYADFERRLKTLLPMFAQLGITAMEETNWNPAEDEARRQTQAFEAQRAFNDNGDYEQLLAQM